jgi:hypothetical protein
LTRISELHELIASASFANALSFYLTPQRDHQVSAWRTDFEMVHVYFSRIRGADDAPAERYTRLPLPT